MGIERSLEGGEKRLGGAGVSARVLEAPQHLALALYVAPPLLDMAARFIHLRLTGTHVRLLA
jgi:hypothetical protein